MSSSSLEARVLAPLATLLDSSGHVDPDSMARQIESLRGRAEGLMPAIGCGEGPTLSDEQWQQVLEITIAKSDGLPVYMGIQGKNWLEIANRLQRALKAGADGVVVGLPRGDKTSNSEIAEILSEFATSWPTNYIFYWESFLSERSVTAQALSEWCVALGAAGVKDSIRNSDQTRTFKALCPSVRVYEGWEDLLDEGKNIEGIIGPLVLLSDAPLGLFGSGPDWSRCRREAREMGLLGVDYVQRVKEILLQRKIAVTTLLADEVPS